MKPRVGTAEGSGATRQLPVLFRRVIGKICNDVEIKGWCKEQEEQNAANRVTVPVISEPVNQ